MTALFLNPESWILKTWILTCNQYETNQSLFIIFFTGNYFYRAWLFKAKTGHSVEISFQQTDSLPQYAGLFFCLPGRDYTQSWQCIKHNFRKLKIMTNHIIFNFQLNLKKHCQDALNIKTTTFLIHCKIEDYFLRIS